MLAAIAHEHRSRGFVWPRGEPAVRETMAGIRRTIGTSPATKKAPVGDDELAALVATLGNDLAGLRDRAMRAWLDAAGIKDGPVFRGVDRYGNVAKNRLSDRTVARVVQRAALAAGLDPARYGGHSLRSGFMTTAAEKGRPLEAIMSQTGHKSERVARGYIQHATVFVNNPAKGLV
jgi:integrase-like protein